MVASLTNFDLVFSSNFERHPAFSNINNVMPYFVHLLIVFFPVFHSISKALDFFFVTLIKFFLYLLCICFVGCFWHLHHTKKQI